MRNALAVLVPVCIGLSSGFIVPSSIQETTEGVQHSGDIIERNSSRTRNILKYVRFVRTANATSNNTNSTERINLEKINNDIYEYIVKKDVNLTERAFIYIKNQRSKISGERLNRKNKSFFISISNIFDELHRRFHLGHVDKNIFNTRKFFETSGHRCKGKSRDSTVNYTNSKFEDQKGLFNFFGIPITLYDLENVPRSEEADKDIRKTTYFNDSTSHSEKRLHREPYSSDEYEQRKLINSKIKDISEISASISPNDSNDSDESDEDGDEILDYLINKALEYQIPKSKNHIIQNGFHYCRDCIQDNLNKSPSKMNCTCGLNND